jgi:hypothetical protein
VHEATSGQASSLTVTILHRAVAFAAGTPSLQVALLFSDLRARHVTKHPLDTSWFETFWPFLNLLVWISVIGSCAFCRGSFALHCCWTRAVLSGVLLQNMLQTDQCWWRHNFMLSYLKCSWVYEQLGHWRSPREWQLGWGLGFPGVWGLWWEQGHTCSLTVYSYLD